MSQKKDIGFFYSSRIGRLLQPLVTFWALTSILLGKIYDTRLSRWLIGPFIRKFDIKMDDYIQQEYKTFNDFFSRHVKPDARPINQDPAGLISPADGHLTVMDYVTDKTEFPIKGVPFNLSTFLKDDALVEEFKFGTLFVVRLSVDDYHRFHFPCDGEAKPFKEVPGKYHTVRPGVYHQGMMPLQENYRHIVEFHTEEWGKMLIIPIGALGVSRIVESYKPGLVKRGDEMGFFQFGGSVVVVAVKSQPAKVHQMVVEKPVKMGESLATKLS